MVKKEINQTEELKRKFRIKILEFEHTLLDIERIIKELRNLVNC